MGVLTSRLETISEGKMQSTARYSLFALILSLAGLTGQQADAASWVGRKVLPKSDQIMVRVQVAPRKRGARAVAGCRQEDGWAMAVD